MQKNLLIEEQSKGRHQNMKTYTRPAGVREYEKRRSRQLRPMPNRYMTHKERRVFLQPFKCYKNTRHGRSVIIGFQKTQIYQRFAGSRQEVFILKFQNDENNAAQQDNGRRFNMGTELMLETL